MFLSEDIQQLQYEVREGTALWTLKRYRVAAQLRPLKNYGWLHMSIELQPRIKKLAFFY